MTAGEATGIRDVPSGPLLRAGHDRYISGLTELVDTVHTASGGRTKIYLQLIDFLAIKRRPEREKFLGRFLQLDDGYRSRIAPGTLLGAVQEAWPGAAGDLVAAQADPVAERDGTVTISCRSATWAQELDLVQADLLLKLRAALAGGPFEADLAGLRFSADAARRE